jgi:hypothetical protein
MFNQNNEKPNMENQRVQFLGELITEFFLKALAKLNVPEGKAANVPPDMDDPEVAFEWGKLLSYMSLIALFYEKFKINLLTFGVDDKAFAQELLEMCLKAEHAYEESLENAQSEGQAVEHPNNEQTGKENQQLQFLAELVTELFLDAFEELDTAADKAAGDLVIEPFNLAVDMDDPETSLNLGTLLACIAVIVTSYEEFKMNLLAFGIDDKEFASELLEMCLDFAREHHEFLEFSQANPQLFGD